MALPRVTVRAATARTEGGLPWRRSVVFGAETPDPSGRDTADLTAERLFFGLLAVTPVIPYIKVPGGLALNDFPPIVAALLGLTVLLLRCHNGRWQMFPVLGLLGLEITLIAAASAVSHGLQVNDVLAGPVRWMEITVLVISAYMFGAHPRARSFLLRAVTLVATADALIGLAAFVLNKPGPHYLGIEPFRSYQSLYGVFPGRITGTLGLPASGAGALFALALPVAAGYALGRARWSRFWWSVATLILSAALLLTFDRVSTVVGVLCLLILLALRSSRTVAVGVGLAALGLIAGTPLRSRFVIDSNDRLALWAAAIRMIKANWLLGVGPDQYTTSLPLFRFTRFGVASTTAHNSILEAAATVGFLGGLLLTLAIVLSLVWLRSAVRDRRAHPELLGAWLALAGFALTSLTVNFFFWPQLGLLFWTLAAALSRVRERASEPAAERSALQLSFAAAQRPHSTRPSAAPRPARGGVQLTEARRRLVARRH